MKLILIVACLSFPMMAEAATTYQLLNNSTYILQFERTWATDSTCYLPRKISGVGPQGTIQFSVNTDNSQCALAAVSFKVLKPNGDYAGSLFLRVWLEDLNQNNNDYVYGYSFKPYDKSKPIVMKSFRYNTTGSFVY